MHDAATVREALVHLGIKYSRLNGQMEMDHILRFVSAVMNRLSKEMREKQTAPRTTDSNVEPCNTRDTTGEITV